MTTLTIVGEPFPDAEAQAHAAAARLLTEAVAETAPRGFGARLIIARDSTPPVLNSPKARVEIVPANGNVLPRIWRNGFSARPLDGEFVHSVTPLVPLRAHRDADGSQSSVMVPHTLAWDAPELMGQREAKRYMAFVGRAMKFANVVLAPTHSTARRLTDLYEVEVNVLPLAALHQYAAVAGTDASTRTEVDSEPAPNSESPIATQNENQPGELQLPESYIVTTAHGGEQDRLDWVFNAMLADSTLPHLVVIRFRHTPAGSATPEYSGITVPEQLTHRVTEIEAKYAEVLGQVLEGAELLAMPHTIIGTGYEVLGAIESRVPVVHAGCEAVAELALDAGVLADTKSEFAATLSRLTSGTGTAERERLRLFADDLAPTRSWDLTARQLWELHATL